MPEHFSLVRQAWIPVALADGRRVFVRPCDISEPYEGQAILRVATGRPDRDVSLTEFLIGLLAVTIGPVGQRDWLAQYRNPPSRKDLAAALGQLEPAMILDGDGPRFFQDLERLEGEANSVEALFVDAPGTNSIRDNADHFVKRGRTGVLSRAGAAIALLTLQTMAPAGGAGHRTSLRGGGPLTTIVLPGAPHASGPTLWQRLWANVSSGFSAEASDLERVFPWLVPTRTSDKNGAATTPDQAHPAQAFFGMPRRIRLDIQRNENNRPCDLLGVVDDYVVTGYVTRPWGTNYVAWGQRHPLSPHYKPKKEAVEYLPVHLQSSRIGYRQYVGMVMASDDGLRLPARCVSDFYSRAQGFEGEERRALLNSRLFAAGYAMDNMKPLDFAEALVPLIATGDSQCDEITADIARRFVAAADLVANATVSAVKRALFGEKADAKWDSTVFDAVRHRFWADTEQAFYRELRASADRLLADKNVLDDHLADILLTSGWAWLDEGLKPAALAIFDDTAPIEDAESDRIKDVIEARKGLVLAVTGYGAAGRQVFSALGLPVPETNTKKGRMRA